MKNIIKRLFIWLGIAFFFIFIASIIISLIFEEEIGQQIVTQINQDLVADLEVADFRLSLIKGFPNVSANLQKVVLPDNRNGVLLEAENMSFRIGLLSLLSSNLKIKSVLVENGALFVEIDQRGKANYFIQKPSKNKANTASSSFGLSLDEAILKDIELIYIDKRAKQEMKLQLEDASFSGEFSDKQFSLTSEAEINSNFVELTDGRYFVGKPLGYDAKIYVDLEKKLYKFQEVELSVAANVFDISGIIAQEERFTDFDLQVKTKKGSLESVIQLLPEEYQYLEGFKSRGDFTFDATVKGKQNERENPVVNLNFGLKEGI